MGCAVDAVGGSGDHHPAGPRQSRTQGRRHVGAVVRARPGTDDGHGTQGPHAQRRPPAHPQPDRARVPQVLELARPFLVAGTDEPPADGLHRGQISGGVELVGTDPVALDPLTAHPRRGLTTPREQIEEFDGPVPPTRPEPPGGTGEPFPDPVADGLEQEHLALRLLERDACGYDPGVVDDDECFADFPWKIRESAVHGTAKNAVVDEQPRRVSPLGRMLCDQFGREVVVELG